MTRISSFWQAFIKSKGLSKDTPIFETFHFERTETLANALLNLVLKGQKKATASSYYAFEKQNERLPKPGDLSIVTDWDNNPWCVIETTKVIILPFKDMTYDICKEEGEDDTLESWRKGHQRFYEAEGKELGYTFSEAMPVVFESFKVVYQNHDHFSLKHTQKM